MIESLHQKRHYLQQNLLAAATISALFSFDMLGKHGFTLMPVTAVVALVIFSFSFPFSRMLVWSVVYVSVVALTLWIQRGRWEGASGNVQMLLISRVAVVGIAALLACLNARMRKLHQLTQHEIERFVECITLPVVITNRDGWIVQANAAANAAFDIDSLTFKPFFELFHMDSVKGKAIEQYLQLVDGKGMESKRVLLRCSVVQNRVLSAIMFRLDSSGISKIVTIIENAESKPPKVND